jgi:ATP-dependent Lhr-like helicase
VRELGNFGRAKAVTWLQRNAHLDVNAAVNLADYIAEQNRHTGTLPTDRSITVERFRDELGDWRVCILSPFGARVHAPWSMALQQLLSVRSGFEVQVMYTDDGIVLRFADIEELPELESLLPDPDEVEELVTDQLAQTALFAGLFRENAVRSLLLPRRRPDQRNPLWAQRLKAQNLLAAVRKFPSFPIVLETYRQALSDVFDVAALRDLLGDVRARRVQVHAVETPSASPFARSLVFAYVAAYIYEQDAPLAERKAQALTLDRNLLRELLGQAELRELIDPLVMAELEAELQHLAPERRARDLDEVHDLLRRLGDLNADELAARAVCEVPEALDRLAAEHRAVRVKIAGVHRWLAAADVAAYRDALGTMAPPGLPEAFLQPPDGPLEFLLQRYARTHGPFLTGDVAERFGLRPALLEPVLGALAQAGLLVQGEIRPGGAQPDWCDADVLRRLKRRTLARLRHAVAPVDAATLGLFLPQWHELNSERQGLPRLLEVLAQLEALELPWSALHTVVLPARIAGFTLDMLDLLAASGQVVWIGCSALGVRDGRVALYLRAHVRELLVPSDSGLALESLHRSILDHLEARGASFLFELEQSVREQLPSVRPLEFEAALWDLVWAGRLTNDTFAPLRALGRRGGAAARAHKRSGHSLAGGRWSLVSSLIDAGVADTERTLARANLLLERYGVVSREVTGAEDLPGGFGPLYKVLAELEDSGRVRRGYFVEGLSGAQFARPGTVDRLRGVRRASDSDPTVEAVDLVSLPVVDPANPWGSLLPWPETGSVDTKLRPRRVAGAWVLLFAGNPVLYVGANRHHLITFPANLNRPGIPAAAFAALHRLPGKPRGRSLVIEKIDGQAVHDSAHFELMQRCGFIKDYRGLASEALA